MTELSANHAETAYSRRLSATTRLAATAIERAATCGCGAVPAVLVLRGFDKASRDRASEVARRLRLNLPEANIAVEVTSLVAEFGRAGEHRCAVVDATGRVTHMALMAWRWQSNQPERGRLAVSVDGDDEVVLEVGFGLEIRPHPQGLDVEIITGTLRNTRWTSASSVQVRQLEGLHLLSRDGVLVDDAPDRVRIIADQQNVARRV